MLPKEAYWTIKVLFQDEPGVYLVSHWNYPAGTTKPVFAVAKGAVKAELYINGNLKQTNTSPNNEDLAKTSNSRPSSSASMNGKNVFRFNNVAFDAGEIKVIAYDSANNVIGESSKKTHGVPASLKITPYVNPAGGLLADASDVAFFDVEALDAEGNRCITYEGRVDFEVSGPARWQGGYNSGKQNTVGKTYLDLECGITRVSVRSKLTAGEITLKATLADGGLSDTCTVVSRDSGVRNGFQKEMSTFVIRDKMKPMKPYGPGPSGGGIVTPPDPDTSIFQNFGYSGSGIALRKFNVRAGDYAYTDETVTFTSLPGYLLGSEYIQMANAAKASTGTTDFVVFTAGQDMKVYVAFSDKNGPFEWLSGFTLLPENVVIGAETYSVYSRDLLKSEGLSLSDNTSGATIGGSVFVVFGTPFAGIPL
jgi:beta-galactosidase